MKLYRIKHKPTGGYYTKERFHYTLSPKGKVYKARYEIGSIGITLSKSSPYYINNPDLNWYTSPTNKNEVKLDTHYSDWEIEPLSNTNIDRDALINVAERATMADMYEHYSNIDDTGALFFEESFYTEEDVFKEEYQDFFNTRYDLYKKMLGIED